MDPCLVLLACAPGPTGRAPAAQLTLPVPLQGDNGEGDLDCAGSPGLPGPPGLPGQRGEEVRPVPGLVRAGQGGCCLHASGPQFLRGSFIPAKRLLGPLGAPCLLRALWGPPSLRSPGTSHGSASLTPLVPRLLSARGTPSCTPSCSLCPQLFSGACSFPPSTLCSEITFSERRSLTSRKLTSPNTTLRTPGPLHAVHMSPSEDRVFHSSKNIPHASTGHHVPARVCLLLPPSPLEHQSTLQGFLCLVYGSVPSTWTNAWGIIAAQ